MGADHSQGRRRLTEEQRRFCTENGYLFGLPAIYGPAEVERLNREYQELLKLLRPGEDQKEIREWHESGRYPYDICAHPQILDYVEDLLGPNYYLRTSNFFAKRSPPVGNRSNGPGCTRASPWESLLPRPRCRCW